MKRRTIIIIITVVIILSIAIPYFAPPDLQLYISNVSTIVSLFSTLLTLVLALILYNQLGLDQTLLQRKADVVFTLLDLLNERSFVINTKVGYAPIIWLTSISRNKAGYVKYGHIKILFNRDYVEYIDPIIRLSNNVFLPKEILVKIQDLEPQFFGSEMEKVNDEAYGTITVKPDKIQFAGRSYSDLPSNEWGSIYFKGDVTIAEFIEQWDSLIVTTVKWIEEYSSYQELNIPFFRKYKE
ncbi:hypothetical protein WSM22_03570 [Cytophagales bacterium WSM2-2]|nr:hypothetical protein WSM22_03570 [Cytophagales bacterium WSM2-2]